MGKSSWNYSEKNVTTRKILEVTGVVSNVSCGSMNLTNPVDNFGRWICQVS